MSPAVTRECNHCGRVKPLKEFPKHKLSPQGRLSVCSDCRNKRVREKRRRGEWLGSRGWR